MSLKLIVVTAMVDPAKTNPLWRTWREQGRGPWGAVAVLNGRATKNHGVQEDFEKLVSSEIPHALVTMPGPAGPIKAFARGVGLAADLEADLVACLHDDLRIDEPGWTESVVEFFEEHPRCVLAGFGGAYGVGSASWDYSLEPENGDQLVAALARHDFISNMEHAEAHGSRVKSVKRVAVLDGFSLIGRVGFMSLAFARLDLEGLVHHGYDTAISLMASQMHESNQVWMLPVACHHHGGMSAVAMPEYHNALAEKGTSDAKEWERSHRWLYRELGKSLPRLPIDVREL